MLSGCICYRLIYLSRNYTKTLFLLLEILIVSFERSKIKNNFRSQLKVGLLQLVKRLKKKN